MKQNLIRTVSLIGDALHPDHLETHYRFSARGDFITHMQVPCLCVLGGTIKKKNAVRIGWDQVFEAL